MKGRSIARVMLVVVLLAGAAWLWMRHERAKRPGVEARPVRCEACGGEYIPRTGAPDEPCPQCGGTKHVVVMWYRCRDCGHTWIGFEQQSDTGLFRRPGGEWVGAAEFDPTQTCPECGSTRASSILRPSAQGE